MRDGVHVTLGIVLQYFVTSSPVLSLRFISEDGATALAFIQGFDIVSEAVPHELRIMGFQIAHSFLLGSTMEVTLDLHRGSCR
jgi:hypothetical protein